MGKPAEYNGSAECRLGRGRLRMGCIRDGLNVSCRYKKFDSSFYGTFLDDLQLGLNFSCIVECVFVIKERRMTDYNIAENNSCRMHEVG